MLARVARIFEQLTSAWDVLRTMTPSEYTEFRDSLGQSSGFQSWQYRAIEFLAGNRNVAMLKPHAHRAGGRWRSWKKSLPSPASTTRRCCCWRATASTSARRRSAATGARRAARTPKVLAAWKAVYAAPEEHWTLYELAEKLVDFEDYFRRWRFNHVTTVERIIGLKRGTGGTAGVSYLRKMLEVVLFPELWKVRTEL